MSTTKDVIAQTLWNEHLFYADALVYGDKMITPDMAMAERLADIILRALEPQQEEAVAWQISNGRNSWLETGKPKGGMPAGWTSTPLYAHPTPVQKVQESQTVSEEAREAIKRIRDAAMLWTLKGQLPEAGVFGTIAQDADWLHDQFPPSTPLGRIE